MTIRRFRRKVRCLLKHGRHGCPHIERHSRRPRPRRRSATSADAPPELPVEPVAVEDLVEPPGRHVLQ